MELREIKAIDWPDGRWIVSVSPIDESYSPLYKMGAGEDEAQLIAQFQEVQEERADARLRSAAPELLKALRELHDLLEEHEPVWYLAKHHKAAQVAIDKALTFRDQ